MRFKISDLVAVNMETLKAKDDVFDVEYADTGSVTAGIFGPAEYFESLRQAPSRARRVAMAGDTVYSTVRPNQRHFGFITNKLANRIYSTGFAVLHPNPEKVLPYYFYLIMNQEWVTETLQSVGSGSTSAYPSIRPGDILNLEVEVPDLETQRRIVNIFQSLDGKMLVNNQINDNLLELASTLFEVSFPNVRDGEDTIGSFMNNFDKKRKPLSKNQRAQRQGKYRYIGATSVVDYVDDFTFDGIYLLLGEDGTVQTDNGKPVLQYVWGPFWPNNHTHVLQGHYVTTEWLYLFWRNQNITRIVTGAVQPKISQRNMNGIKFTKPTDTELAMFQQKIDPIFSMIRVNTDEIENLKVIRDQLLRELLS